MRTTVNKILVFFHGDRIRLAQFHLNATMTVGHVPEIFSSLELAVLQGCRFLEGKHAQTSFGARVRACMCSSSGKMGLKLISL